MEKEKQDERMEKQRPDHREWHARNVTKKKQMGDGESSEQKHTCEARTSSQLIIVKEVSYTELQQYQLQ